MKKVLLIDLTSLYGRKLTGIELYAVDFYKVLTGVNCNSSKFEIIPIYRKDKIMLEHSDNNKHLIVNSNRFLTEQYHIPKIIKRLEPTLVIYPAFPPGYLTYYLKSKSTKIAVVIHDTVPWKYPDTLSLKAKLYLKPLYDLVIKKADYILTVSQTVKEELISMFKLNNVFFIGSKISDKYSKQNVIKVKTNILKKLNLNKYDYLLSVSTIEPRKNLKYLLAVYKELIKKGLNKKLVLVGRKGWDKDFDNLIEDKIFEDRLVFTGYISDEDLITLYKNCSAFCLFSIYEGFGRPPLEALACGAKVIVSDIPVFRETLKEYACYVPLNDVDRAAEICMNCISNTNSNNEGSEFDVYNDLDNAFRKNISRFLLNVFRDSWISII